jgi:hypothetical protein
VKDPLAFGREKRVDPENAAADDQA